MRDFSYLIQGAAVEFDCYSAGTCSGFKHCARCYVDGWPKGNATRHYYNRTWERYTFESVCRDIARQQIEKCTAEELAAFKEARGYRRMNEKRRAEFAQWRQGRDEAGRGFWEQVESAVEHHGRSRTLAA